MKYFLKTILFLFASLSFAAQAVTYEVVTTTAVQKKTYSEHATPVSSFNQQESIYAFVSMKDFDKYTQPSLMEARWYKCGELVSQKTFKPTTIESRIPTEDGKVKRNEYNMWFWIDAAQFGAGDGMVEVLANGITVSSAQFNVKNNDGTVGGCSSAPVVTTPMPDPQPMPQPVGQWHQEVLTMDADGVFQFNGSAANEMYTGADAKVDAVVQQIQAKFQQIDSVTVNAYTDYLGSDDYNVRLSQKRADTISRLLIQRGIDKTKLHAYGLGEANPVVQCDPKPTPAETQLCLAPNRRVEVVVTGLLR